jgi:hypothetical protein
VYCFSNISTIYSIRIIRGEISVSTYTPIASVTLSSAQSSVTFSGIPQTYTDLVLVANGRTSADGIYVNLRLNNDTSNTLSATRLLGNGSSASSSRATAQSLLTLTPNTAWDTTNPGTIIVQIQNYSNTTTNKTMLVRGNIERPGVGGEVSAIVGMWASTAAVNRVDFSTGSSTFLAGTTFNLYGVANASITNTAKATGGDTITTDGTYWYHTFYSSGTFTPTQALTADYLVVAGGGAGGKHNAGGGGAGGMRCTVTGTGGSGSLESPLSLTAQAYTVTIGAGGAASSASGVQPGASGSNSVFATITSTGGGGGGGESNNGLAGGSGGGGGANTSTGGAASPSGQGFAGANGGGGSSGNLSGGGGGASAAGTTGSSGGGNGGAGRATSISGTSVTYAGGGGGGANSGSGGSGGAGGGANAGQNAGTANTGGGGGGGNDGAFLPGGNGGSGIVIVRYAV